MRVCGCASETMKGRLAKQQERSSQPCLPTACHPYLTGAAVETICSECKLAGGSPAGWRKQNRASEFQKNVSRLSHSRSRRPSEHHHRSLPPTISHISHSASARPVSHFDSRRHQSDLVRSHLVPHATTRRSSDDHPKPHSSCVCPRSGSLAHTSDCFLAGRPAQITVKAQPPLVNSASIQRSLSTVTYTMLSAR